MADVTSSRRYVVVRESVNMRGLISICYNTSLYVLVLRAGFGF